MKDLLLILLFAMAAPAHAFINIEEVRRQAGEGFVGKSNLQTAGQRGNTDKFSFGASTLNIYRMTSDEFLLLGDYSFAQTESGIDTNNGRAHLRYTRHAEERLSHEVFAQTEFDQFRKLQKRDLFGAGLRQRWWNTEKSSLYSGYGSFYEHDDWDHRPSEYELRASFYLSYVWQIEKRQLVHATLYYQPSWTELRDYRLQLQVGMSFTLTKRLAFSAQVGVNRETDVPQGVKPTDVSYQSGFSVSY